MSSLMEQRSQQGNFMNELLSLTRAARFVGVTSIALPKKIWCGEMIAFERMVTAASFWTATRMFNGMMMSRSNEYRKSRKVRSAL
jgi:hypothetical protein